MIHVVGPYYKFRTYHDMIHNARSSKLKTGQAVKTRLIYIVPAAAAYLLVSSIYNIEVSECMSFHIRLNINSIHIALTVLKVTACTFNCLFKLFAE